MSTNSTGFRSDIELLRGVAVVLVVLFHLKLALFKSGFIGVDIFFVLSGYLMAAAFCGDIPDTIAKFYERRARRVLPAALLIMLGVFIISPLLFLPFESEKNASPFLGMLLFIPNVIFWKENDYFADLAFSPMLHYWTLGIELQYYLVFPLIVYLFKRRQWAYVALALGSLALSIVLTKLSSQTAFFLLPTRIWEFFAGYFAFILYSRQTSSQQQGAPWKLLLAILCLLGLVVFSVLDIPERQFPGYYAIPPVLLCFVFIVIGLPDSYQKYIPGAYLLRQLGKLSYSIYLIHFPVIFLFLYSPFSHWQPISHLGAAAAAAITLALSIISYNFIERPFRNRTKMPRKAFIRNIIIIYALSLATLAIYSKLDYFRFLYPPVEQKIFSSFADTGQWRCSKLQKLKEIKESSCYLLKNPNADKRIYLVGDSHIDSIKEAFVDDAMHNNVEIRLNRNKCFLGYDECASAAIIAQVEKFKITDVVLHGYDYPSFNYSDMAKLFQWANSNNVKIHVIGPVPTYSISVPMFLYNELHNSNTSDIRLDKSKFQEQIFPGYTQLRTDSSNLNNVFFYEPEQYLCTPICMLSQQDEVLYYDPHHLTLTGARLLNPIVQEIRSK